MTWRSGNVVPLDSQVFSVTFRNHETKKKKKKKTFVGPPSRIFFFFPAAERFYFRPKVVHMTTPGTQES